MARETKVGLIAGLAFIICFAVILANRGGNDSRPKYVLDLVNPRDIAAGDWQVPPLQRSQRRPEAPKPRVQSDSPPRTQVSSADATAYRLSALEKKLDALSSPVPPRSEPTNEQPAPAAPLTVDSADATPPQSDSQDSGHAVDDSRSSKYTVVSGDTLSKIAHRYYGSKSIRFINAICDANRSVLDHPDHLRVGVDLIIPVVAGSVASPSVSKKSEANRARSVRPPVAPADSGTNEPPFRWYQIKKNDGYARIAREQLGDESRWPEIHELNRDKFADPQQIRAGVRIKLPTQRIADSRKLQP